MKRGMEDGGAVRDSGRRSAGQVQMEEGPHQEACSLLEDVDVFSCSSAVAATAAPMSGAVDGPVGWPVGPADRRSSDTTRGESGSDAADEPAQLTNPCPEGPTDGRECRVGVAFELAPEHPTALVARGPNPKATHEVRDPTRVLRERGYTAAEAKKISEIGGKLLLVTDVQKAHILVNALG